MSIKILAINDKRRVAKCLKCGEMWSPYVEFPKQCPKCKSIRWHRPSLKIKRDKYGFNRIKVGEWSFFPWIYLEDGKDVDRYACQLRNIALSRYMSRHGYTYLVNRVKGTRVDSGLYVMRKT